jgi:hypothetical protein
MNCPWECRMKNNLLGTAVKNSSRLPGGRVTDSLLTAYTKTQHRYEMSSQTFVGNMKV